MKSSFRLPTLAISILLGTSLVCAQNRPLKVKFPHGDPRWDEIKKGGKKAGNAYKGSAREYDDATKDGQKGQKFCEGVKKASSTEETKARWCSETAGITWAVRPTPRAATQTATVDLAGWQMER